MVIDRLAREPDGVSTNGRGRRPAGWGEDDDAAEASSMRAVAQFNRSGRR